MRDPEQQREPWTGLARLIVTFEVGIDGEDDVCDPETAGQMARDQLRDALEAAAKCKILSRTHRAVLGGWGAVELVEMEDSDGDLCRPK